MNHKTSRLAIIAILAIGFVIASAGCSRNQGQNQDSGSNERGAITIGAVLPMTGNFAFLGEPVKRAMDLAVSRINEEGGINGREIDLVYADSEGNAKTGVNATLKLINSDNVEIITSFITGVSEAIKPIAEDEHVLLIAQTVSPTIAENAEYTVRMHYSFEEEGRQLKEYMASVGDQPAGFIYSSDPSTSFEVEQVILPYLEDQGFSNMFTETFDVGNKEFRQHMLKMQFNNVEQLYLAGYGSDFPNLLQAAETRGLLRTAHVCANLGFVELPEETPTELREGVVFATPPFLIESEKNDRVRAFEEAYRSTYGVETIGYSAYYGYDTIQLLREAIEASPSVTAQNIRKAIGSETFNLMTGDYRFSNGDAHPPVTLGTFEGKEIVPFQGVEEDKVSSVRP